MRLVACVLVLLPFALASGQDAKGDSKYEDTLKRLVESMSKMTKTLALIVDEETAKENRSVLRVEAAVFIEARKKSQDLAPPSAEEREKLAQKYRLEIEKTRKELVGQVARVQRVPGGNAALQEIRDVFDKKNPDGK
jgi:hypothetical protein